MQDMFDVGFEQSRLNLLTEQCLAGTDISGEVIFGALEEENRHDFSNWNFSEFNEEAINASGFKHYLVHLLDDLIVYRTNHKQELSRCGVLTISHSQASIKWVSDYELKTLSELKRTYTNESN